MQFKNITSYKFSWLHYQKSDSDALILTKPVDPTSMRSLPLLKAIEIEFDKSAFKKDFDEAGFITALLNAVQLEYLGIGRGNHLTQLPEIIARQMIRNFKVDTQHITDFGNVLPHMKNLEQLSLSCSHAALGKGFGHLENLKMLSIRAENIADIDQITSLEGLEYLALHVKGLTSLPAGFGRLKNLKVLIIDGTGVTDLPDGLALPLLETLRLSGTFKAVPKSILESRHLKDLALNAREENLPFTLPPQLHLPALERIEIHQGGLESVPELILPSVKRVSLSGVSGKSLCGKLREAVSMEELWLKDIRHETDDISLLPSRNIQQYFGSIFSTGGLMDFKPWLTVKRLLLEGTDGSSIHIADNTTLAELVVRRNDSMQMLPQLPANIQDVKMENCAALETVEIGQKQITLKYLNLGDCPKLKHIVMNSDNLPDLRIVNISNCPSVESLPPELLACGQLIDIRIKMPAVMDDQVDSVSALLEYIVKNSFTKEERLAVGYWLFNTYDRSEPSASILETSLRLLRFSNDTIFKLISKNFRFFNTGQKVFNRFSPEELKGKKMAMVGNTFESKTALKESLKNLGLEMTTKLTEADFLLAAKKADIDLPLSKHTVVVSETELHQYQDQHQPKFLKQPTTTETHLTNLRQILWSNNPETELMALEMLKQGGLPDEVIGECIAVAKTSADKGVKDKYKSFLKGKVSEEAFRLVSKNVRFEKVRTDPFYSLSSEFPVELVGKFAMALYQRTKTYWNAALNFHEADFNLRREIIDNHVVPEIAERPHYIQLFVRLTKEELGYILSLPVIKGELKRLHVRITGAELPDELGQHITLKDLVLQGDLASSTIPPVLFSLVRLSELRISSDTLEVIDDRIGDLKQLQELFIYNKKRLQLPDSIRSLPKLKRAYFSGGITNTGEEWAQFLSKK
jgi:Leucine-rich repeat (LRR) protein